MLSDCVIKSHPTGSNYICNPPVTDTDIDTVLLVQGDWDGALIEDGYSSSDSDNMEYDSLGIFTTWRKGNINYIVTEDERFYNLFVKATEEAKFLNLKNKEDRISLFQKILYGA